MPRLTEPSRSRTWPRLAILAVVGVTAAGCADSARFDSNPFASNRSAPSQDVTGSISSRPVHRVEAQPLPAPTATRPYTVPAGVASGAQGLGAYRPGGHAPEYTGSVPQQHEAAKPAGHWTWNGGTPIVVGRNDTLETIARKYGVPAHAILETNGVHGAIRPGERLVIPRYVVGEAQATSPRVEAPHVEAPRAEPVRQAVAVPSHASDVHVVQPGESLIGIGRRYGLSLAEIARLNHIQPYTKVNVGDRITVPGRNEQHVASRQPVAQPEPRRVERPRVAQAAPPIENVGTVPTENARVATPEPATAPENPVKKAEAVAANKMPQFRWPVTGHVIEAFGPRPNGTTNDGINLAVPVGTPIKAAEDGVVAYAGNELKGYGNLVLVRHADNFVSAYANASEILVKRGDSVKRGQVIARAGQTGNVTSPQLHFEIRKGSTPVDPRKYLASN
ncbi:MAG TPA: peptidoglycan DD-metalloendopeptidase family protein [Pseudolabrys sp.]|nr:peptidoglycan DD-metalloendopeptidase family protein [Pseudolabrys sp.]